MLYLAWCALLLLVYTVRRRDAVAPRIFVAIFRENRTRRARSSAGV